MDQNTNLTNDPPPPIGKNFVWLAWSGAISIANSVLVWVFLARMRSVEEVGHFTIVMGLYALFAGVVSLGLMPYLVNEVSRRARVNDARDDSVSAFIASASVLLFISGIVSAVLMSASVFLLSSSWIVRSSTVVLSLGLIPSGLVTVSESAAISFGRARLVAVSTTLENVLRTLVPLTLIWYNFDIIYICGSFAAVRFVALAVYIPLFRGCLSGAGNKKLDLTSIVRATPTFAGITILSSINWQMAIVVLGYLSTDAEIAKYGAASRFLIPVSILMASYASVIQPSVAKQVAQAPQKLGRFLTRSARIPVIVASLAAIGSPFLSKYVLTILYGESYADAAPILDILALCVIPFSVVMVTASGLVATGSQRVDLFANALGATTCLVACGFLIPRYGAVGAAAAQACSFTVMALVEIGYISGKIGRFSKWRSASMSSAGM